MDLNLNNVNIKNLKSVYFIGIGGIGVSALALWCLENKISVYGYDRDESQITKKIESKGGKIFYEYEKSITTNSIHFDIINYFNNCENIVVYSSAIKLNHPLLKHFLSIDSFCIKRSNFLGLISKDYDVIAIAGTHGKTTISTMLTHILKQNSIDCTSFLGGLSNNYNSNFILGKSKYMVVEADEFDRSFLSLRPKIILISSMDRDHSDTYKTYSDMYNTYLKFIKNSEPILSSLIVHQCINIKLNDKIKKVNYSLNKESNYTLKFKKSGNKNLTIRLLKLGKKENVLLKSKDFKVPIYPLHNLENFLAASVVAIELGLKPDNVILSLKSFLGVQRRFQFHINNKKQVFIEDYAHHPKEIDALVKSLRAMYGDQKITMIFQPHLFSRTKDLISEFADSLSKVDEIIILDIYGARENPISGFSVNNLFDLIKLKHKYLVADDKLVNFIHNLCPKLLVSVGAGDITKFSEKIKSVL
tara:strand:+ start:9786 stop:11207 length:1422 start_codon:yes stop_codon:yes gene_type:complete